MPRSVATTRTSAARRRATISMPGAIRFSASTHKVTLDANNQFVSTSPFAASVWCDISESAVNPTNSISTLFSLQTDIGVGYIVSYFGTASSIPIFIGAGVAASFARGQITSGSQNAVRDIIRRGWHMWTVVFDGVDYTALSSYKFYIDNTNYVLSAGSSTPTVTNINTLASGGPSLSTAGPGNLSRYRVWQGGTAMTAAQVAELFYNDTVPTGPTLIREYLFTEGTGTTLADTSGNGMTGTIAGSPTWLRTTPSLPHVAFRPISNCLSFDGAGDGVSMGNTFSKERTDAFSYSAWINQNQPTANGYIISKADASENGFGLKITPLGAGGNKLIVTLSNNAATNLIRLDSAQNIIPSNSWQHVCVTYDGSSTATGTKVYLNGQRLAMTTTNNTLSATIVNTAPFCIGGFNGTSGSFKGNITNVRIYSAELTATQVADEYYNAKIATGSVQGEWLMTDGSGATLTASVGGTNGTITGAVWSTEIPFKARTVAT